MRWEDERYVRVYTRDTVDWLSLSFIAQGLFCLILRKVDRAGLMKLGKHGRRAVAVMVGFPGEWSRLEPALEELLADGSVQVVERDGDLYLLVPNFIEAQEANQSDAQRKRESRARARDLAAAQSILVTDKVSENEPNPDKASDSVTDCPESGQKVTSGHTESQAVTPSCAVPSRAEPREKPRSLDVCRLEWEKDHPATAALLSALDAGGLRLEHSRKPHVSEGIEADVAKLDTAAAVTVVREAHAEDPHPNLGWYAGALHRAASSGRTPTRRPRRTIGVDDNGQPIFEGEA